MATVGPNTPSAAADSGYIESFTNIANSVVEDGSFATYTKTGSNSAGIDFTGFGWTFPAGAVLGTALLEVKGKVASAPSVIVGYLNVGAGYNISLGTTNSWNAMNSYSLSAAEKTSILANTDAWSAVVSNGTSANDTYSIDSLRVTIIYTIPGNLRQFVVTRQAVMRAARR